MAVSMANEGAGKPVARIPSKAGGGKVEISEQSFSLKAPKNLRASLPLFSKLGFDHVSSRHSAVLLRKAQSHDILGKPHLFVEVEIRPDRAILRYSCPMESDRRIRRMESAVLFLQVIGLLPSLQIDSSALSGLALPSLEDARACMSLPYGALLKRNSDLQDERTELLVQNRRLLSSLEASSSECAHLQKKLAAVKGRLSQLERVPDRAVDEFIIEWLSTHRGSLNFAHFSLAHGIAPARCEERLAELLRRGAVKRSHGAYLAENQPSGESFQLPKRGISIRNLLIRR